MVLRSHFIPAAWTASLTPDSPPSSIKCSTPKTGPDFTFPDPASSPGPPCINGIFWSHCQNPSSGAPFFFLIAQPAHQPASWLCLQRIVCLLWSLSATPCLLPPPLHSPNLSPCPHSCSLKPAQTMALHWPQASPHTLNKIRSPLVTSVPFVIWPLPSWVTPLLPPLRAVYVLLPSLKWPHARLPFLVAGLGFTATCSRKPSLTSP